ncbi:MAG: M20/M25/M40 family metallo-hydrolase [Flammeovirgaceae bacterium]|nr:M20/M25/M40 family metallo-hydrolase [Flammeovirgaceae bacterium]
MATDSTHEKMELLKTLCQIHAPSGDERLLTNFLIEYIQKEKFHWKKTPEVYYGDDFQECIVLVFGKPRTAIFAHIDTVGFTVRYDNELVKIGKAAIKKGIRLKGKDSIGEISCEMKIVKVPPQKPKHLSLWKWWLKRLTKEVQAKPKPFADFSRLIERGTTLTYDAPFLEKDDFITSCYLDNRLGVWVALEIAKELEEGIICFSCNEEQSGGTVPFLAKFIYEKYGVRQALIADISWITAGILPGKGAVISYRDNEMPRQAFIRKIVSLVEEAKLPYQREVEDAGSSDGRELQAAPYPFDWCFIGAPEDNVHTPEETVHKKDIQSMLEIYRLLMKKL